MCFSLFVFACLLLPKSVVFAETTQFDNHIDSEEIEDLDCMS